MIENVAGFRQHKLRPNDALIVFARDSIYAKRAYAIAIPSVRLSVRHTGDSCKNG